MRDRRPPPVPGIGAQRKAPRGSVSFLVRHGGRFGTADRTTFEVAPCHRRMPRAASAGCPDKPSIARNLGECSICERSETKSPRLWSEGVRVPRRSGRPISAWARISRSGAGHHVRPAARTSRHRACDTLAVHRRCGGTCSRDRILDFDISPQSARARTLRLSKQHCKHFFHAPRSGSRAIASFKRPGGVAATGYTPCAHSDEGIGGSRTGLAVAA